MAVTSFSERILYLEKGGKDVTDGTEQCDAFGGRQIPSATSEEPVSRELKADRRELAA
jgi:hypothetical protein